MHTLRSHLGVSLIDFESNSENFYISDHIKFLNWLWEILSNMWWFCKYFSKMLDWIKCDKTQLFAENLSEQLHSMARRVFCVGTLNFWKAFERLPLVGFERLRGSQWGRRRILESRHNCHLSLRIKHCSMPVTVGQWPVKFFPTIERRFTSRPVGRSQWIRGLSHLIGQDGCSWIPWVGGFIGCPFHFYPFSKEKAKYCGFLTNQIHSLSNIFHHSCWGESIAI